METTIIHIMESWPLQLVLQSDSVREDVVLDENVRIYRAGVLVDPGVLRPGQRVRVLRRAPDSDTTVTELEIIP
ncbi:hypothetical protein FBQ96_14390 [Nitrospirales bacterium NOB]|nr:MAG: hypothetical protein UZ03_NOB001002166 [Nitrospira sp. OLB3]MBV6468341.1 hypothetical protein [Nitrospirota bacterium]MDL1890737.1 hypothetical protein [Nitrospirales bacterium NOB]MEB2339293.1 hypothetical protein [Nitrospirales bacterium]RIK61326.1 MAG: hypothetical protein DCC63_00880 [Nitrospira sp.]